MVFVALAIHGRSGVSRAVLNIAGALAESHEVEIISVYGGGDRAFAVDDRISVQYVVPVARKRVNTLSEALAHQAAQPSTLTRSAYFSALTDAGLTEALGTLGSGDIVISTRPSLHELVVDLTGEGAVAVGWDHLNFPARQRPGGGSGSIRRAMPGLAAFVVLTEADHHDYAQVFPDARIQVIRNANPWPSAADRTGRDTRTVVAAGRLAPVKGFDRLIDAWALVARDFPAWRCRIHGTGPLRAELQARIDATGITTIELAGNSDDMRVEYRAADVFALSSHLEGLPMTIIEALSQGTPVVSFDCPRGPGELVHPGNGRLVPDGDVPALAAALAELMGSPELREDLGRGALAGARRFDLDEVTSTWRALLADLT